MNKSTNVNLQSERAFDTCFRSKITTASKFSSIRTVIVDLNRFTSFPTLAIGILTASLRARGHSVQVICPMALGIPCAVREREETVWDDLRRRIRLTDNPAVRWFRDVSRTPREWLDQRPRPVVLREIEKAIAEGAGAILLSAYLENYHTVRAIGALAKKHGVPVILGGPMFNMASVSEAWRSLPGLAAIVGAEAERYLPELLEAMTAGESLDRFAGVTLPDGTRTHAAPPLRRLDDNLVPDFDDFPWDRYPNRIIPVLTGRGCQWDKCTFCSDVISASGRTFRTRSVENVLVELQIQADRCGTKDFMFLDLKLNSYPGMLRGISNNIQKYVRGAQWIGTVHVDLRSDNGLSRRDLFAASAAGMRRVSFGLESGSQRLLDSMRKGCSVEANATFLRNAYEAGLSVRCTMFKGYPGETAADMEATADFLEANERYIDRIRFNDFAVLVGTPIHEELGAQGSVDGLRLSGDDVLRSRANYSRRGADRAYRRAKARALATVYEINRRPLGETVRQFDGLM